MYWRRLRDPLWSTVLSDKRPMARDCSAGNPQIVPKGLYSCNPDGFTRQISLA